MLTVPTQASNEKLAKMLGEVPYKLPVKKSGTVKPNEMKMKKTVVPVDKSKKMKLM